MYYTARDAKKISDTLTTELTLVYQWLLDRLQSFVRECKRECVFFTRVKHMPDIFLHLSILNACASLSILELLCQISRLRRMRM